MAKQLELQVTFNCENEIEKFNDNAGCEGVVGPDTPPDYDPTNDVQGCFISD